MRRRSGLLVGIVFVGAVAWMASGVRFERGVGARESGEVSPKTSQGPEPSEAFSVFQDEEREFAFRLPSGQPAALSCDEARRIVAQVETMLAYEPTPVDSKIFARGTSNWLDPHEFWSLAEDSPVGGQLDRFGGRLLHDLTDKEERPCEAAQHIGEGLKVWVDELGRSFDEARRAAQGGHAGTWESAAEPLAHEDEKFRALPLAREMGRRAGLFEAGLADAARGYVDAARERFFPSYEPEGWTRVVLAAAVRAYVESVDPHGGWAPFDEEASIYELDLSAHPPTRPWLTALPAAIGARMVDVLPPLSPDDLLLSVAGLPVAGLPIEQLDQLGYAVGDGRLSTSAVVWRRGESSLRSVALSPSEPAPNPEFDGLATEFVRFGSGEVLVVTIPDVRDDLGDALARALHAGEAVSRERLGVVLDLRGNGGGSTDGAVDALGLFIPGARLFPMKRRDGAMETDVAPSPPTPERWVGPLATLVDGSTASAAEMIAGALAVYRRGLIVGERTYGKGCAQEYLDDDAHAGVLRLTTLLFALPDGSPVQRVGLTPSLTLSLGPAAHTERESKLPHVAPTWRGPDIRVSDPSWTVSWPAHGGNVGPCVDANVCRALRALGAGKRSPMAKR